MADMGGYDANQHEPSRGFEPLPAGEQVAMIIASELKTTSTGTGTYLAFTFEVLEGPYKGRKLFKNVTRSNKSKQAVDIGNAELSALCRAIGVMQPKDSCELHNIPMIVGVKLKKRQDTGEMQNELSTFKPKSAASPAPPAAAGAAPWKR